MTTRNSELGTRKSKKPNKRVTPRAESFVRIAKVLRVRAATYRRIEKTDATHPPLFWKIKASILSELAAEFSNEAATLRSQR